MSEAAAYDLLKAWKVQPPREVLEKEVNQQLRKVLREMNRKHISIEADTIKYIEKLNDKDNRKHTAKLAVEKKKGKMFLSKIKPNQVGTFTHLTGMRDWSLDNDKLYQVLYTKAVGNDITIVSLEVGTDKVKTSKLGKTAYKFTLDVEATKAACLKDEEVEWLGK